MSPAGEERHSEHFENIAILLTHDMIQASQEVFRDTGKIAQCKRVHCFLRVKRKHSIRYRELSTAVVLKTA